MPPSIKIGSLVALAGVAVAGALLPPGRLVAGAPSMVIDPAKVRLATGATSWSASAPTSPRGAISATRRRRRCAR